MNNLTVAGKLAVVRSLAIEARLELWAIDENLVSGDNPYANQIDGMGMHPVLRSLQERLDMVIVQTYNEIDRLKVREAGHE